MTAETTAGGPPERAITVRLGTSIGLANPHDITIRGENLVNDLIGHLTYTEMALLTILGHRAQPSEVRVADAVLASLVDHGMQPSALAARLTYHVAPEALQGAVAAGLLGAGSLLLGSMERCGRLLTDVQSDTDAGIPQAAAVRARLEELLANGERIPGVGHALHKDGDPRAGRLLAIAEDAGICERQVADLLQVPVIAREITGRDLPVNVTGAASALLLGIGIPWELHRGFAMISRIAGLLAHINEERLHPLAPAVRGALREASWLEEES